MWAIGMRSPIARTVSCLAHRHGICVTLPSTFPSRAWKAPSVRPHADGSTTRSGGVSIQCPPQFCRFSKQWSRVLTRDQTWSPDSLCAPLRSFNHLSPMRYAKKVKIYPTAAHFTRWVNPFEREIHRIQRHHHDFGVRRVQFTWNAHMTSSNWDGGKMVRDPWKRS